MKGYLRRCSNASLYIHPLAYARLRDWKTIVDLGCGTGRLRPTFPQAILIGIDVREEAVICLDRGYNEFLVFDVENQKLPELKANALIQKLDATESKSSLG